MARNTSSILSVSYEPILGQTRQWLLEKAGFSVTPALGIAEAIRQYQHANFDLVLMGHSIPKQDKMELVTEIRKQKKACIVSIHLPTEAPLPGMDAAVDLADGPKALITSIRAVLATKD